MDDSQRDQMLIEIHTHVKDLRTDSTSQDQRITVLEHWRTAMVSGIALICGWMKIG